MTAYKWSQTAASNSNADATVNWAEGQAPSSVNDSARAMMAALAKLRDDVGGNLLTGGSTTAFTLTSNQGFVALTDGIFVTARVHATSGAAPTLNVDSLGAKQIQSVSGTNVPTGLLPIGSVHTFVYDSGADAWIVHGHSSALIAGDSPDLVAIEALATTGIARRSAANTWALDAGVVHLAATTANRLFGTDGSGASGLITLTSPMALAASALSVNAASDDAVGAIELAIQSEMETATDVGRAVTPGRQHFHPAHPKMWGHVTVSGGTPAISTSHNLTSVTDSGQGVLTATIATDFSSANWCPGMTPEHNGVDVDTLGAIDNGGIAAGTVRFVAWQTGQSASPSLVDPLSWNFWGFGDQA